MCDKSGSRKTTQGLDSNGIKGEKIKCFILGSTKRGSSECRGFFPFKTKACDPNAVSGVPPILWLLNSNDCGKMFVGVEAAVHCQQRRMNAPSDTCCCDVTTENYLRSGCISRNLPVRSFLWPAKKCCGTGCFPFRLSDQNYEVKGLWSEDRRLEEARQPGAGRRKRRWAQHTQQFQSHQPPETTIWIPRKNSVPCRLSMVQYDQGPAWQANTCWRQI